MSDFLDEKGIALEEIIGKAVPDIMSPEKHDEFILETDRPLQTIYPVVDTETCTKCGTCGAYITVESFRRMIKVRISIWPHVSAAAFVNLCVRPVP